MGLSLGELALECVKLYVGTKTALGAFGTIIAPSVGEIAVVPSTKPMRLTTHRVYSIEQRLEHIIRLTKNGRNDPKIRKLTAKIISRKCGDAWCIPEKDWEGEVRAIFKWVRSNIRYSRDIESKDTYQAPMRTVEMKIADCDDTSILIGAMLLSAGYPVKMRVIRTKGSKEWNHIFPMVGLPPGGPNKWVAMDATVPKPAGWHPPADMIDKMKDFTV